VAQIQEKRAARARRHVRVRKVVRGTAARPRLCVFKSLRHIYAQIINDDEAGRWWQRRPRPPSSRRPASA